MVAVHDGTANINIRNVNNVKCVNCKNCINLITMDGKYYYVCTLGQETEFVEECIANDDNMECDAYVEDCHDDFTERS